MGGMTDDLERQARVVCRVAGICRGENNHLARRDTRIDVQQIVLDASDSRREVVGDEEQLHGAAPSSSAMSIRSRTDGCVKKAHRMNKFGSRSAMLSRARFTSTSIAVFASRVARMA